MVVADCNLHVRVSPRLPTGLAVVVVVHSPYWETEHASPAMRRNLSYRSMLSNDLESDPSICLTFPCMPTACREQAANCNVSAHVRQHDDTVERHAQADFSIFQDLPATAQVNRVHPETSSHGHRATRRQASCLRKLFAECRNSPLKRRVSGVNISIHSATM